MRDPESKRQNRGIIRFIVLIGLVGFCVSPCGSPPLALVLGIVCAGVFGEGFGGVPSGFTKRLLQVAVVLLGFGIDLPGVLEAGWDGILLAGVTIVLTLVSALVLGRLLGVERATSELIGAGTAICGGSAIAALSGVVRAESRAITVAMGTVFVLNAVALLTFPAIGHALSLTQDQYGTWAGVAIHDVSSVVGAAEVYGDRALQVATAVKLSRTLWIVPVCFAVGLGYRLSGKQGGAHEGRAKIQVPWFIGLFLLASVLRTYVPGIAGVSGEIVWAAKAGFTVCLLLIGSGISFAVLMKTGWRPLLLGLLLWIGNSVVTLLLVMMGV